MKKVRHHAVALICLLVAPAPGMAAGTLTSPYAGEEKREIKTLSPEDVEELRLGRGWGLARAAELNGLPGPAHLLEMADEINLSAGQRAEVQALFEEMQKAAIPLGLELIERERDLNLAFAEGRVGEEALRRLLDASAESRRDLRYVHLSTHLKARPLLTDEQVNLYNRLRGYGSEGQADEVPEGHDLEMWRRHRGGN
jgi:Spy/CpxP family protein refolding chaperone